MPNSGAIADDVVIYLHIGQMKTGTTALQHTLARERENLLQHGVLYPKTGTLPKHSEIVWSLLPREKLNGWVRQHYSGRQIDEVLAELEAEISDSGAKTVVISCEEISLHRPALYAKVLERWKSHLRVVVYLRRQDEMLESMYKFQVLHHRVKSKFADFCTEKTSKTTKLGRCLDYDRFLAAWEEWVGRENIQVSLFEADAKADLWGDFMRRIGHDIPLASPMERENVSVSGSFLEFLRRTNSYVPPPPRRKLVRDLKWLVANSPRSPLPLCPDQLRQTVLERFAEGNRGVAQRYFGRENLFQAAANSHERVPGH